MSTFHINGAAIRQTLAHGIIDRCVDRRIGLGAVVITRTIGPEIIGLSLAVEIGIHRCI